MASSELPMKKMPSQNEAHTPRGIRERSSMATPRPMSSHRTTISQTSFPSQTGPIARRMKRRSLSVRAAIRWIMPAPRSKPSSSTYMVSINVTRINQSVDIVLLLLSLSLPTQQSHISLFLHWLFRALFRTFERLDDYHQNIEQAEEEVHSGEAQQCENDIPCRKQGR